MRTHGYRIVAIVFFVYLLLGVCSTSAEAQDYIITKTYTGFYARPSIPRLAHLPVGDPRRALYYGNGTPRTTMSYSPVPRTSYRWRLVLLLPENDVDMGVHATEAGCLHWKAYGQRLAPTLTRHCRMEVAP